MLALHKQCVANMHNSYYELLLHQNIEITMTNIELPQHKNLNMMSFNTSRTDLDVAVFSMLKPGFVHNTNFLNLSFN